MVLFAAWAILSCEAYREGCMDANATNFQISNQVPCCCEYPLLIFQTTLTSSGETRAFTDTFTHHTGEQFLIRDLRFIASDITLRDSLDRIFTPTDTFDNYMISPDILAVDVFNLNSKGGEFMTNGRFTSLDFVLDRPGSLADKTHRDFPLEHPFRDSMFYDFQRNDWHVFKITVEIVDQGLLQIQLTSGEMPVPLMVSGDWTKRLGADLTVNFRMDVDALFAEIEFGMEESAIRQQIAENLPVSIEP